MYVVAFLICFTMWYTIEPFSTRQQLLMVAHFVIDIISDVQLKKFS